MTVEGTTALRRVPLSARAVDRTLGAGLVVAAAVAAWVWLALRLLPGGYLGADDPTWQEGLVAGVRNGTATACLVVLSLGSLALGVRVLRRGRAVLDAVTVLLVYGGPALAALSQRMWLLAAGALVAGAALLGTARTAPGPA